MYKILNHNGVAPLLFWEHVINGSKKIEKTTVRLKLKEYYVPSLPLYFFKCFKHYEEFLYEPPPL